MLGIDLNIVDNAGHTALDYAIVNKTIKYAAEEANFRHLLQVNPSISLPPGGMPQPAVNASPVPPQLDLSRPPNFEAPEPGVVQKLQEKAIELLRGHLAQNANTSG